eukprot:SAG31_NODE_8866_length_1371_cov_1.105346_2_plen_113_part_00
MESYLRYQGARFVTRRFDPNSYVILTHMMDSHDVSRGRGEYIEILNSVQQPVLVIGIKSDVLYPLHEQQGEYETAATIREFVAVLMNYAYIFSTILCVGMMQLMLLCLHSIC